jgi:hypothetical protein
MNISDPLMLQFLSHTALETLAGKPVEGMYKNMRMFLKQYSINGKNVIFTKVLRHEMMHKFWDVHIPERVRTNIINYLASQGKTFNTTKDLHEYLAEEYSIYRDNRTMLQKFLDGLKRFLDFILGKPITLEQLFRQLDRGKYKEQIRKNSELNKALFSDNIVAAFGSITKFKQLQLLILTDLNNY